MKKFIYFISLAYVSGLPVFAAGLESTIENAIVKMATILSLIMIAACAWAGFEMRRGMPDATNKLIYSIVGLIVVNTAQAIVTYFKF